MGDQKLAFDFGGAASASAVPLAHVPRFMLGPVAVEPALRQVSSLNGRTRKIEPLVMQMLIALRASLGSTLSRDDLIAACWDGAIVSDDAVNRVVSKLRRVLTELGEGAVRLETVAKVGYRLTVERGAAGVSGDALLLPPSETRVAQHGARRSALVAIGALATVVAGTVFLWPASEGKALTIGVEPATGFRGDRAAASFASDITNDLARLSQAYAGIELVDRAEGRSRPDVLVRVAVARDAGALVARARMVDTHDDSVLWSHTYRETTGDASRLRDQAAVGLAGLLRCSLSRGVGSSSDRAGLRLLLTACDALSTGDLVRAEGAARKLVALRPDASSGWACLALITANLSTDAATEAERSAALANARAYIKRALELDPKSGMAHNALARLSVENSAESLAVMERGLKAAPNDHDLNSMYAVSLFNLGYVAESVAPALRGLALDPSSQETHGVAVRRLLAAGRFEEALAIQEKAEKLWPDSTELASNRRYFANQRTDLKQLLNGLPKSVRDDPVLMAELRYRAASTPDNLARLDAAGSKLFAQQPSSAWQLAAVMTRLGQPERALDWLQRAPLKEAYSQWSLLFWPEVAPLRRDPRFFAAMARLGLLKVWRARGVWPDFCAEPGLRYDCRTEAARLSRNSG